MRYEHGKGDEMQPCQCLFQTLVVTRQAAKASHPGEAALNGIIANDKFCMTRHGQLRLSWSRASVYLHSKIRREFGYPLDEHAHLGGTDETPVAHPSYDSDACKRPAALGSSLSEPSAMDVSDAGPEKPDRTSVTPHPGGVSCE